MHHHPQNQERAVNLSILTVSGPGKFPRVESNYGKSWKNMTKKTKKIKIMPKTTAPRTKTNTTVLSRIKKHYGSRFIRKQYKKALRKSERGTTLSYREFKVLLWPHLLKHGIDVEKPRRYKIYKQYVRLSCDLLACRLHTGQLLQGYPVVSCRLPDGCSVKLQLHQIPHYKRKGFKEIRKDAKSNNAVFAHSCHNQRCLVHATRTSKDENNHQTYCKCFQLVGNKLYKTCKHEPRCMCPGSKAFLYSYNQFNKILFFSFCQLLLCCKPSSNSILSNGPDYILSFPDVRFFSNHDRQKPTNIQSVNCTHIPKSRTQGLAADNPL